MHKLDNALRLGLMSAVIVKDVQPMLEFSDRHDGRIDNQKCIAKQKQVIWPIDHMKWKTRYHRLLWRSAIWYVQIQVAEYSLP